jgi:hypothetical protein
MTLVASAAASHEVGKAGAGQSYINMISAACQDHLLKANGEIASAATAEVNKILGSLFDQKLWLRLGQQREVER